MFLADQRIKNNYNAREMSDTTQVYAPIFEKYGYTVEDYHATLAVYIKDPDRYARIIRKASLQIETSLKELEKQRKIMESIKDKKRDILKFAPDRIYYMTGLDNEDLFMDDDSISYYVDSTGGELYFDPQLGRDTIFRGPILEIDSLIRLASLDSIQRAKVDSLARVDSISNLKKARSLKMNKSFDYMSK